MKTIARANSVGWLLAIIVALATVSSAIAQEADRVQLAVKPVGVQGSYFNLTIEPGESRQITVEFGNYGARDAVAMTYAADVFSLVNGGMGVRLAGEPTGETTGWIGYNPETFPLKRGEAQLRTFAASVPADAAPGEYITSIVVQDATPADNATNGGVTANRINRQAIAVAITVPGQAEPALTLGAAEHHVAGGRSVITVEVANSGNVRLQPRGEFVLADATGHELSRTPVTMDSVYAGTSTVADIPFATLLDQGEYIATLSLTDATHGVTATTEALRLPVTDSLSRATAPTPSTPDAAAMTQPSTLGGGDATISANAVAAIATLAIGVVSITGAGSAWYRRSRRQPAEVPVAAESAQPTVRPVTVRQLSVPRRQHTGPSADAPPSGPPRFHRVTGRDTGFSSAATISTTHAKGA